MLGVAGGCRCWESLLKSGHSGARAQHGLTQATFPVSEPFTESAFFFAFIGLCVLPEGCDDGARQRAASPKTKSGRKG